MKDKNIKIPPVSAEFLRARHKFVEQYCAHKGWPTNTDGLTLNCCMELLTLEQHMELRGQDGWKNPMASKLWAWPQEPKRSATSENLIGGLMLGLIILLLFSLIGMCTPDLEDPKDYFNRKHIEQVEERLSPKDFWNIK